MLASTRTRLITGDLDALETALGDAIAAARRDDALAPVTVLVGNVLLRRYLPRALARHGVPQINVDYVLPHALAARLARHAGDGRTRLMPESERLLVRDVAAEAGGYFAGVSGREGFVRALRGLFRELDGGAFTAAAFGDAAHAVASRMPESASKLAEIARLYALFTARRSRFIASSDDYRAADVAALDGPLFVYGAWSLPDLAVALIERIADDHDVTVFLPSSGLDADDAHAALRERLGRGSKADERPHVAASGPPALAAALFRDGQQARGATGVSLSSAPDTVREVWEAARTCIEWARGGVRFHEMAVAYRSSDPYRTLVDEIFAEAGIPTYLHAGRLLSEHPLGRRVLALLDLAASDRFARAQVMEFLTETELPLATTGGYVSPSEWEGYTREAGIIDDPAQWQDRLQRLADDKRHDALREGYEWLAEHADRIERFAAFAVQFAHDLAEHPKEATWSEHLGYLRKLAGKYAGGVAKIIDALDDLHVLGAVREPVSFEVFCRAVRDDLESRDVTRVFGEPVRAFGREGVAVLDASSLRHLRFRAVCLLGVAERAWPPPPRPDPLLLERERRAINEAGFGVIPLRTEPDDEALTFWLAAQSASERLRISYARAEAGSSGKHLPSYFFRAAVDALEGRRVPFGEIEASDFVRRYSAGRLAADEPREALTAAEYDRTLVHAYVERRAGAENILALGRESPAFERALEARQQRWSSALTQYDGVMLDAAAIAAALAKSPFTRTAVSPSRLETYAECPYRYFLSYVLHVEQLEEPETLDRMDPRDRGSLVHDILERFMREIAPDDPPRPEARERHIARLLAIAHEEGEERVRRGVTGKALVWRIDARQIDEDLVRWYDVEAADDSGLVPRAFEVMFGPLTHDRGREADPLSVSEPLAIQVGGREIRLQGRIDRVDWDAARTRFRVIDYKTGTSTTVKLAGGRSLQLPIYLRASSKLLGIPAEEGEAQYFFVSSKGGFKRAPITGAELAARGADIDAIFTTIAEGIDAGFFAPSPGAGEEHCRYCDYRDVCDARIGRIAERKRDDPRGSAFIAMEAIE